MAPESILHFEIGDKVVYPNHGVGVIEQISSRTNGASVEKFYMLKIKASSLKVMIPFHNASHVGLRPVVKNSEVNRIIEFLGQAPGDGNADWKDRYKENSDKLRTGTLLETAAVLKSLLVLNAVKPLSFRERKMLDRAKHLLVTEMSMAKNMVEDAMEELMGRSLAKSSLRFPPAMEEE